MNNKEFSALSAVSKHRFKKRLNAQFRHWHVRFNRCFSLNNLNIFTFYTTPIKHLIKWENIFVLFALTDSLPSKRQSVR